MRYIKIISPLYIDLPRVRTKYKRMYLNMNKYGNTNTFTNDETKKLYKKIMSKQLKGVTIKTPCNIIYQVFRPTKTRLDKMNVIAVTSKYLLDAITELGCWEDDNDEFVKTETILPTEYDKGNGRVEIIIESIN